MPWLGPVQALLHGFALYAAVIALLTHWAGHGPDGWVIVPAATAAQIVIGFCGRRQGGSRVRHRAQAVITACILFAAVSFGGVRLFPDAGHAHPGLLSGLVYLIAAVSAVYAFTAVTHWRGGEATLRRADSGKLP